MLRINTAGVKELTELSRIAKNLAHRIVNRRKRHGKRHSRHAGGKKVG